ncbi:hypothetical protein AB0O34_06545 [Sphaerisporangium sp. NPDC088356]|uniref:hypothetical protein n=1 Tax=Sphaerisporangium sp. NPDC088356 TaxID=3154871 RepID=UPI0034476876
MGGEDFPEAGWFDFPVTILAWWLAELGDLVRGASATCALTFMDGPYEALVRRGGDGYAVELRGHGATVRAAEEIDPAALLESLREAAGVALATCAGRGWEPHPDVTRLRASLRR